jgi:biotin carboxyl carrier protein
MKRLEFEFNGKPVAGWVERVGGQLWVHVDGRTIAYMPPKKTVRGKSRGTSGQEPGQIKAPMPGKVNKLAVKAGDKVAAHQVLVVMEAMKMAGEH